MKRRKDSVLYEVKIEFLDLSKDQQLPTHRYVIERYLTLSRKKTSNLRNKKKHIVITKLVNELRSIWIGYS